MGGRISSSTIEQIRAANDIVEVISAHLPLKRAGANFVALCPFHKEKTPSFNVNPQRQTFHCFGCHKGGNVISFICEYENLDFLEAVRRLADRAGITLAYETGEPSGQQVHLKESLWQIHEQIAQRWQSALTQEAAGQAARDYLARRQVSAEAIQLFRLGFAPEAWDDTINWARSKGWDLGLMEQAGLIVRKEGENRAYDRFRGRLMFPICDELGRVIAFSGRILIAEASPAKYVNSPETPIFSKRKVFYGLDKTKRAIIEARVAVLCEGQLDLIACYMAGVRNIVAPQGTAFTNDHARLLRRYADEVVLCFDSDLAGQKASVKVLDDLLASGLAIRVARLPAPHDPDSYIKEQGGEAFRRLISQAEGFFDFYLKHLCETHDPRSDKGRLAIVEAMGAAVLKTGNAVLLDTYAQKTAIQLQVAVEAVRRDFARLQPSDPRRNLSASEETIAAPAFTRPPALEYWLLKLLFYQDQPQDWITRYLDLEWLQHPGVRQIVQLYVTTMAAKDWPGASSLMTQLSGSPWQTLLSEAMADARPLPHPQQQLADVFRRLRNQYLDRQLLAWTQQINRPELTETEQIRVSSEILRLRELKNQAIEAPDDSALLDSAP
jgi:DNA primase